MVTRVLFVGSYDPAGSGIATRLYREGCRISWLTAEENQALWGSKVHGKVFRRSATYHQCRQILKGESVDCIVVLTGSHREIFREDAGREHGQLLAMLSPLLRAAAAEKVRWICFLSSLCLGEEGLLAPGLEELRAAERIAASFCKDQKISLLTVRMGCIYGEGMMDGAGLMGEILRQIRKDQEIACPFTAESDFDLLCAPDLADAVYRLLNLGADGQVDVATGRPVTVREIYDIAARAASFQGRVRFGQQEHHCPGGKRETARRISGWMPFYPFPEHGAEMVKQELQRFRKAEADAQKKDRRKEKNQKLSPLYETAQNLLLFVIALLLSQYAADWSDLRYVDVRLLYVMIVAITFGMRQGLLATGLASVSYMIDLLGSGIDASYLLYSIESWIPFVIYGVAGAFGGYWSDKKRDDYETLRNEFLEQQDRYRLLQDLYREVLDIKNQLQKQIVISRDSFNRLYAVTEDLDSENPRMVLIRTVRVMEEIMECGSVAIYLRLHQDSRYGRLMACSDQLSSKLQPSLDFHAMPRLRETMDSGVLYVNKELDPQYPAFAMPVSNGETSIALVELYDLSVNQYTVYYRNLFETLVRMVQHNLVHAYSYQMENRDKLYLPGTGILTAEAFEKERETLQIAREEYSYPSSIACILPMEGAARPGEAEPAKQDSVQELLDALAARPRTREKPAERKITLRELSGRVEPLLRGTDLLGMGADGRVRAAFLYLDRAQRPVLEQRFARHGFRLAWED